jgi:DNA repair exonuclease SbcCD nuclease subunit
MANLFKRAAIFTDLHLGYKSNSQQFLTDCENYMDWFIGMVCSRDCDSILFLGDFHHNRNSINIQTMDMSLKLLQKLDDLGLPIYFIPGNHDLYHKDRRTVSSVKYIQKFQNIHLISDQFTSGDVTFVPWLIGEEYKNMRKIRSTYVMGHFELPHFKMNAMVEMPDHGELKADDFGNCGTIFTGHFHKRQQKGNVHYIGNAFPHNYADAWDDDRGMMVLEWGCTPEYINWPAAPKYRVVGLKQLIDDADRLLNDQVYIRVNIDIPISYEEANFIKEEMAKSYNVREITLLQAKQDTETGTALLDQPFESVDQIIMGQIQNLDTEHYDKRLLMEIYNNL